MENYIKKCFDIIEEVFELGKDENGACTALAYSERLAKRTLHIQKIMEQLGMETRYDGVGNLIALYRGKSNKKILIASHLDSVFNAGRFDGVLGVVLPLVILEKLKAENFDFQYSLEIISFMGEESPGITATYGSKVACDLLDYEQIQNMHLAYQPQTKVAKAYTEFMKNLGYETSLNKNDVKRSVFNPEEYLQALEVHIEQFYALQRLAKADDDQAYIGVMQGVGGHLRKKITLKSSKKRKSDKNLFHFSLQFNGQSAHSGATPMGLKNRADALVKSAEFIMQLQAKNLFYFYNYEVINGSLTSVPALVNIDIACKEEHQMLLKEMCDNSDSCTIVTHQEQNENNKSLDPDLIFTAADLILKINQKANQSSYKLHVRATVSVVNTANNSLTFYLDVRGADVDGMQNIVNQVQNTQISNFINLEIEHLSAKKPIIFPHRQINSVENILSNALNDRIMKGEISVPGQDIGNVASMDIPSSLLFVESGTGHHPNEAVRSEAMEAAFKAAEALIKFWNKN